MQQNFILKHCLAKEYGVFLNRIANIKLLTVENYLYVNKTWKIVAHIYRVLPHLVIRARMCAHKLQ